MYQSKGEIKKNKKFTTDLKIDLEEDEDLSRISLKKICEKTIRKFPRRLGLQVELAET